MLLNIWSYVLTNNHKQVWIQLDMKMYIQNERTQVVTNHVKIRTITL